MYTVRADSPNDGGSHASHTSVHVGMTVTRDGHDSREGVTLLNHDLMPNSPSGGVEVDTMGPRKGLDARVLGEVRRGTVLHVVVEGEDRLTRVRDLGRSNGLEPVTPRQWEGPGRGRKDWISLGNNGTGIVLHRVGAAISAVLSLGRRERRRTWVITCSGRIIT